MPIRIGVIGTGIMGSDHIETVTASISGAEISCIADIDAERAEMIAPRVPGAKALPSAESLIESPEQRSSGLPKKRTNPQSGPESLGRTDCPSWGPL
jgi:hypothetical protein